MPKLNGVVFYEGPSLIDRKPIVGVATLNTENVKTGNLVQTWIIPSGTHPVEAAKTGEDYSVCGDCPLRGVGGKQRACYVLLFTAPSKVFLAYQRGLYPTLDESHRRHFLGKGLRYGSYGDPVAIPLSAWKLLETSCSGRSRPGYTHQWRKPKFQKWKTKIMASTHSLRENEEAGMLGWRTFRTVNNVSEIGEAEIVCPATAEGGYTASCFTCGACNGRRNAADQRKSVVTLAHGSGGKTSFLSEVIQNAL